MLTYLKGLFEIYPALNIWITQRYFQVRFGACGMQGWRNTMEDSHIAATGLDNNVSVFGVFDGHGGN